MQYRRLGRTGLTVSAVGYGGAPIGFAAYADRRAFLRLLGRALDLGITFFDTAPDYRESELLIGEAIRGRRDAVVLATKCGRLQEREGDGWHAWEEWSEAGVLGTVEASLRRLGVEYLDLLQLHSPPMWVLERGETWRGMQRARERGLVRHLGVSADGAEAARALALDGCETLQVSYSILQQEPGDELLPAAAARGIGIIVKQPLANAVGELRERPEHPDWNWKWDVAQRMGSATLGNPGERTERALRWVLADPLVSTAIVGTANLEHLEANVRAAETGPLPEGDVERAKRAYRAARLLG